MASSVHHVQAKTIDWTSYASDPASTKFSPANLINPRNIKNLKVVWNWTSIDEPILKANRLSTVYNETTPLMVDGRLYLSTQLNQIVALNAKTGQKIWSFDPSVYKLGYPAVGFIQRGVTYWSSKLRNKKRIFALTNNGFLYSLDAETGELDPKFGVGGRVDLKMGLSRPAKQAAFTQTSPALFCGKTLIVGSSMTDVGLTEKNPRGDVRGFDPDTGALKWTFHTVPQKGDWGVETWKADSWKYTGSTNVWAPMSADLDANLAYLPVSSPANDFFGGRRKGDGLFGDSLVGVDCDTGLRKWHFQLIHHALWDYDPPAAPVLFDIKNDHEIFKGVAQVTKQGFVYVFDRITGRPVWPIVEQPVPQSDVMGEETSPTQPFPTKPKAFERQGVRENDLIDFTPELRAEALKIIRKVNYGPLFSPPSFKGTISLPGWRGGASWSGAAFSPITNMLYIPSITDPHLIVLNKPFWSKVFQRDADKAVLLGPRGLPLFKPPYGRITAINMESGENVWMRPIGRGPKNHPALAKVDLPKEDLGWARRIHVLVTPSILFAAQDGPMEVISTVNSRKTPIYSGNNDDPRLRALDPKTGKVLAEVPIPGNAFGAPMTYVLGHRQYIVIPYGGAGIPAGFVALSL